MLFAQAQAFTTTATLAPTTTAQAPDIQPYVVQSATAPTTTTPAPSPAKKSSLSKWFIIGGGVLAAASLAFVIAKK